MHRAFFAVLLALLFIASCGDEATAPNQSPIRFPTATGLTLRYADFIDTSGTGRFFDSLGIVEEKIVGSRALNDTTGLFHQNTLFSVDGSQSIDTTLYAYFSNNQEQWIYLEQIEDLVGDLGVQFTGFRSGWYPFLKTNSSFGANYSILPSTSLTFSIDTLRVEAVVKAAGNVRGTESVSVQGKTYQVLKIVITLDVRVTALGLTQDYQLLQHIWCADNIGVVKFETSSANIAGIQVPNSKQELISATGNQ
jgi:hypothetical protein